ncbi:ethionine resistance protein [Gnomoniopsis sp. IMI 355080]|nr:ethionine resistance protein [Gnomoniopsis sp. IMI 355080]
MINFGLVGGTLATGTMYWLATILTVLYIAFVDGHQAWAAPTRHVLRDLTPFARLMGYGLTMVGAEWWAFELIAIAAGTMGHTQVAAQSILMTTDSMLALVPFGLGVASTNRVASLIGRGQMQEARLAARASSCIAFANGCLTTTLILALRGQISRAFAEDPAVISLAVSVFPWGAAFQVVDSLQAANSGCLRAIGRADIGATVNLFAYYAVALPLGLGTGIWLDWGLHGLWVGLATALAIVGIGECALVNLVSWDRYTDLDKAKAAAEEEAFI